MVYFKLLDSKVTANAEDRYNFKNDAERETIYPRGYLNDILQQGEENYKKYAVPHIVYGDGVNFAVEISKDKLKEGYNLTRNDDILNKYNYMILMDITDDPNHRNPIYKYCFIKDVSINGAMVAFTLEIDILTTELPKNVLNGLKNVIIERRHQKRFYKDGGGYTYDFRKGTKLNKNEDFLNNLDSQYVNKITKVEFGTTQAERDIIGWRFYEVQNTQTNLYNYFVYPVFETHHPFYYKQGNNAEEEVDDPSTLFDNGGTQTLKTTTIYVFKILPANGYSISKTNNNYTITNTLMNIDLTNVEGYKFLEITNLAKDKETEVYLFGILNASDKMSFFANEITDEIEPKLYKREVTKYSYISGSQRLDFSLFDTSNEELKIKSSFAFTPMKVKERIEIRGAKNGVLENCLLSNAKFSGVILKNEINQLPQSSDAYIEYCRNNSSSAMTGLIIPAATATAGVALGAMTGGLGMAMVGGAIIGQVSNVANYAANMSNLKAQPDQLKNSGNDGVFAINTDTVKDYIEEWTLEENVKNGFKKHLKLYGYTDGGCYDINNVNDEILTRSRYNYLKFADNLTDKITLRRGLIYKQKINEILNNGIRLWEITNDINTTFKNENAVNNIEKEIIEE